MNRAAESSADRRSHASVVCEVILVTTVAVLSLIVCLHDAPTGHRPTQAGVDQLTHLYSWLFPTPGEQSDVH